MTGVQHRSSTIEARQALFDAVVEQLEQQLADPDLQIDDIARAVFSSRRQVQRVMGEQDTTFRTRLTDLRMSRAGQLLVGHPRMPVRQVAVQVGYRQPAQFAKAFRRHFGCTPSQYRADRTTGTASSAAPSTGIGRLSSLAA